MILRAEHQPEGQHRDCQGRLLQRRQFQGCTATSGVQPCVCGGREDSSSGPGIQHRGEPQNAKVGCRLAGNPISGTSCAWLWHSGNLTLRLRGVECDNLAT